MPQSVSTSTGGGDDATPYRYTAAVANELEVRWQGEWARRGTFKVANPGEPGFDPAKPKFYCLDMFPYPSGAGLHVGHPEGYTATDIVSRYKRMTGHQVLHPMGWDAFGLPAEQYAIQTGVHPAITTRRAIETFRRQLQRFGFSYDWSREIATMDPKYYRWTQWIFLRLYESWYDKELDRARPISELIDGLQSGAYGVNVFGEPVGLSVAAGIVPPITGEAVGIRRWHELDAGEQRRFIDEQRLAYVDEQVVNWCPKLGTALANEEVIDGRSERGGFPVFRKPLRQWILRITAYAERLLRDLELVDWPESTRAQQTEWIGRSEGAEVEFALEGEGVAEYRSIRVYTTRPDTIFGATYMVLAPEHPIVDRIISKRRQAPETAALEAYQRSARNKGDVERAEGKEKTGVFTGVYAMNPATGKRIPVWVADYVLMGYGTGAIMAVPGQDQRDWEFAEKFGLPIVRTVKPPEGFEAGGGKWYLGEGPAINSGFLDGLPIAEAKQQITAWLEEKGIGIRKVNYRLRDWLFSRQRYWGEPFPVVWGPDGNHYPVAESALPVVLPELADFQPVESDVPMPLLGKAAGWVKTTAGEAGVSAGLLPPQTPVVRETNTMPNWAGSCWYFLRFCDPHDDRRFCGEEAERYWMQPGGVDLYIGGAEHAVLHLLYARFWHKVLFDLGYVSTPEPFRKLFHQGLITSFAYQDSLGGLVPADQIVMFSCPDPTNLRGAIFPPNAVIADVPDGVVIEQTINPGMSTASTSKVTRHQVSDYELKMFLAGKVCYQLGRHATIPVEEHLAYTQVVAKMSKSLKNVVNPDDVIAQYGADTFRLYEMYMGPLAASKPWNPRDIAGPFRFLQRLWRNLVDEKTGRATVTDAAADSKTLRLLHKTIAGVRKDIEGLSFNTAIAKLIELNNHLTTVVSKSGGGVSRGVAEPLVLLLAPFAPHIAEELWVRLGREGSTVEQAFPEADPALAADQTVEIPVSLMGKVRGHIMVPADADAKAVEAAALAEPKIAALLAGKSIKKVIVVPGRMVSIVAS